MCYDTEFGRSTSNRVNVGRGSQNLGTPGPAPKDVACLTPGTRPCSSSATTANLVLSSLDFYRATLCVSAVFSVARYLSVRLSVRPSRWWRTDGETDGWSLAVWYCSFCKIFFNLSDTVNMTVNSNLLLLLLLLVFVWLAFLFQRSLQVTSVHRKVSQTIILRSRYPHRWRYRQTSFSAR